MNNLLPPPPPSTSANGNGAFSIAQIHGKRSESSSSLSNRVYGWEIIQPADASQIPCQRSLHAGAVWRDYFVVFGGYDGLHRVNDLHAFHFPTSTWRSLNRHNAPSPRDRHVAVVYDNSLYIFGGFDGSTRVNDLHRFNLETHTWEAVVATAGNPPTPRHSHSAVLYRESMYIFGGYDGSYRSDFHAFHFPSGKWRQVNGTGDIPRARYRGTCVVFPSTDTMILHGGHDGTRHLQDTHLFDFVAETWFLLATEGPAPQPRDSHVSVIHGRSMYLYGGSTGSAMGDFHELRLEFRRVWSSVDVSSRSNARQMGSSAAFPSSAATINELYEAPVDGDATENVVITPGARFCHVGVVYDNAFYIFGGYDGANRLNDFLRFQFDQLDRCESEVHHEGSSGALAASATSESSASSSLIQDLKGYVNSELLSDIQFVVEGRIIYAHQMLCRRCPVFDSMFTSQFRERDADCIPIPDVKYETFLLLLEYLYTDAVTITMDTAMDLFQVADQYAIDRLKDLCEQKMLLAIDVDTAAHILLTADLHNAQNLREKCMAYILRNFDRVSVTASFEEMGRNNVDLVFEVLRRRNQKR